MAGKVNHVKFRILVLHDFGVVRLQDNQVNCSGSQPLFPGGPMTTIATPKPTPSAKRTAEPNARLKAWIAALQNDVPRVRTPMLYRLMQLLVVLGSRQLLK